MNERDQLGWLARRYGFGLAPDQLDEWEAAGVDVVVDRLLDGDAHGVQPAPDAFAGLTTNAENPGAAIREASLAWIDHSTTTPRPFETWMTFFWHDYFAVSAAVVRRAGFIHDHFRLMQRCGLGNFGEYLAAMTVDGAMLMFLDGTRSTGASPNENYGRELLELYSVGVGSFTEDDVRAAAIALTGWVARPRSGAVEFVRRRHDDNPQTLLGVGGVHDVETVVDAVTADPACAVRVATKAATAVLGSGADRGLIERYSRRFAETLELRPLFRSLIEDALDGAAEPIIIEPVPWFVSCLKATGATPRNRGLLRSFEATGQVPFRPPNVGGFPPQSSYLSTSATVSRFNIASAVASSVPRGSRLLRAAESHDLETIADAFGLHGFSIATTNAIRDVRGGVGVLTALMASPDLLVA